MSQSPDKKLIEFLATKDAPVVVSAPSGTGKTTINHRLIHDCPQIKMSVSLTTRMIRKNEIHGVDYFFVDKAEFLRRKERGDLLESTEVFGNFYGTSREVLAQLARQGYRPLLEIDVEGWRQIHKMLPQALSIFVAPPNVKVLWERLEGRGTDHELARWGRFMHAKREIEQGGLYDFFIINDHLEHAVKDLKDLVIDGKKPRLSLEQGRKFCRELIEQFDNEPWVKQLEKKFNIVKKDI